MAFPPRPWMTSLKDFCRYMRGRGWRQPILMLGRRVMLVGLCSARQADTWGDNDA